MDDQTAIEILRLSAARPAEGTETARAMEHAIQAIEALAELRAQVEATARQREKADEAFVNMSEDYERMRTGQVFDPAKVRELLEAMEHWSRTGDALPMLDAAVAVRDSEVG